MGTNTSYLQLYRPDGTDFIDEALDLNNNWDVIDEKIKMIANPIRGSLSRNSNQNVSNSFTPNKNLQYNLVDYDVGGITSLATDAMVIPRDDFYIISAQVRWNNGVANTDRKALVVKNSTYLCQSVTQDGYSTINGAGTNRLYWEGPLLVGDVIKIELWHNNGSALDVLTNFGGTFLKIHRGSFTGQS